MGDPRRWRKGIHSTCGSRSEKPAQTSELRFVPIFSAEIEPFDGGLAQYFEAKVILTDQQTSTEI